MAAEPRFYTMQDVSEVLSVSVRQVQALLKAGDLRGIQVGGRGQWRIEHDELERYIKRQYEITDSRYNKAEDSSDIRGDVNKRFEHDNSPST